VSDYGCSRCDYVCTGVVKKDESPEAALINDFGKKKKKLARISDGVK
jgi:hypothetical protein